jgi:hypothetical protein
VCVRVGNQWSRGVVIAKLRSSVQSLLQQCRDLHQSTYFYLSKDQDPTSHQVKAQEDKEGWGRCACRTTFYQLGQDHGASLSHQHK